MATSVHPGLHDYDIDSDIDSDIPAGERVADMDADQGRVVPIGETSESARKPMGRTAADRSVITKRESPDGRRFRIAEPEE
jgi:hypothetical protein